jgi:outer membrane protein assembly factor BamB
VAVTVTVGRSVRAGLAVTVAVASVVAAVAVVARHDTPATPDQANVSSFEQVPTTEAPPESTLDPQWQVDAETVYGREFAAFRAPTGGLQFDSGTYGLIDAGDIVVTAAGLPNPRTYGVDEGKLVGIDAADGQVSWSVSPGGVVGCGSRPVGGEILCLDSYADVPAIVAVAVRDGALRRVPLPGGWFPFAVETDGTSVYLLDGNPEDSESVLRGGSLDALGSSWSRPVSAFAPWEGVDGTLIHVSDGRGVVTLGGEAEFFDPRTGSPLSGLELRDPTSVVDIDTGDEVWRLTDPYAPTVTVGGTDYIFDDTFTSITATESGDVRWTWRVPTGADGFVSSGSIAAADSGVYYVSDGSLTLLERSPE